MASSCVTGGLDWTSGKISLLEEWSGIATGCPGKQVVFKNRVDVSLQDIV